MIAALLAVQIARTEIPYRVPAKLPDILVESNPSQVRLQGYIGKRIELNESARLANVDLKPLLDGFHKQPGSHPWIGEHIGKWIHASTLAWANSGDKQLKAKLDQAVKELISCQQEDGYLGTYLKEKRFGLYEGSDWDVWTHKYDLIGLLTYYRFTGDKAALQTCERIGDLLIKTFGPNKKSILSAGTHMGMAATSILEPIVLLYRYTGEPRYLEFANYIVASWEEKSGPKVISTIQRGLPIDKVGNGKAYEMLSNLVGLCELARATGNQTYLDTAKKAWADVVKHELYITGTASYFEHFHAGEDLPNEMSKNVGETCVTVTWMQLSQQLLRLTGDAKYASEFERSAYNHLAAAQNPDGRSWCYYTSLQGTKPYTSETCCCLSSGPRGMAIIPETAYMTRIVDGVPFVVVNTPEPSTATVKVTGKEIALRLKTDFPAAGGAKLIIRSASPVRFGIMFRPPNGAQEASGRLAAKWKGRWMIIQPKVWKEGTLNLSYALMPRQESRGQDIDRSYVWTYGPFVLAKEMRGSGQDKNPLRFVVKGGGRFAEITDSLIPFADIGANHERFRVWLTTGTKQMPRSLFQDKDETRSAEGNVDGSICDGDLGTFVVTWDQKPQKEAWFSVSSPQPVSLRKVVFTHGRTFHDGGWFDTSGGKPKVQIQTTPGGEWATIGTLKDYPTTTATSASGLRGGEQFSMALSYSVRVIAVRVVGVPACGDNPGQAFASCGELQAFR